MAYRVQTASLLALIAMLCAFNAATPAKARETTITAVTLTDEHVRAAIGAIVDELYERKHPEHYWEHTAGRGDGSQYQTGGHTALVVLALLYAGESYQDSRMRDAIDHLKTLDLEGTYAVAVRTAVWAILPPRFQAHLERDAAWLQQGFSRDVGGWAYYQLPTTTRRDNSLRQFGALAYWEAAKRGITIPRDHWQAIERGLLEMQLADGGWNYRGEGPATGSMTVAGLGTLFILQDFLHAAKAVPLNREPTEVERAIERGMQWLDKHFSATENPNLDNYFYYYMYGIERIGLASGYKAFDGKDWYLHGAAELIRRFCRWNPQTRTMTMHTGMYGEPNRRAFRNEELAFGLMFLTRAGLPPVINKLRDDSTAWNNRPRDVANLTFWLADQTARHLYWQIIDIDTAVDDWLEAPLVYFASDRPLPWIESLDVNLRAYTQSHRAAARRSATGRTVDRLPPPLPDVEEIHQVREYLQRGGLLLAVNEGRRSHFADSIEALGQLMFPLYDWRNATADHWAYTAHHPVRGSRPRIRVLSNGVRDLMVLIRDQDLPATFQVRRTRDRAHYDVVSNVYFYASEMNRPRTRLESLAPQRPIVDEHESVARSRPVTIIRGMHGGNWNPEPQALETFRDALLAQDDLAIAIQDHPLARLDEIAPEDTLVHVAGTDTATFLPEEREAIRRFLDAGGTMLFESPGGKGAFTASAELMMRELYDRPFQPLLRYRVLTGEDLPHAVDLTNLEYRPYALEKLGTMDTLPRLRGMMINGRAAAFFSREDISHALLDEPCWGIHGYAPRSAQRLLRNILLYVIHHDGQRSQP